jgi:hypothetical protein
MKRYWLRSQETIIPQNANSESTTSITQTTSTVMCHLTMSTQATTSSSNSTGTVMRRAPQELNLPVAPPPRFHTPRYNHSYGFFYPLTTLKNHKGGISNVNFSYNTFSK